MGEIRLGSALLIVNDDTVLLGRRMKDPNRGRWVLPGGGVKFGESHVQAAKREALEELGVEIEVDRLAGRGVYYITDEFFHRAIIYSVAHIISGEIVSSSDIADARFYSRDELGSIDITEIVIEVLRDEGWYS